MRRSSQITLVFLVLAYLLVACFDRVDNTPPVVPDFQLSATPTILNFDEVGQNTNVTVNLQRNNTFSDAVTFSADAQNVPAGISIAKNSSDNNQASFRVNYNSVVAAGNYSVVFSARAGNVRRQVIVTIVVVKKDPPVVPDFQLSATPTTLNFDEVGQNTDVTLSLQRNNTFSDAVTFSADTQNVPAGISIAKNSSNNNQANFSVNYNSVVAAGNYSVVFSARAGNVRRQVIVTIVVVKKDPPVVPDFQLSVTPTTLNFDEVGQNTDVTLNLQRNNTFSDAVTFDVDSQNVPAGISIVENSSDANQAKFSVNYNSVVVAGNYSVVFSAEAGNVSKQVIVTIVVVKKDPPVVPDFQLSATPTTLNFKEVGQNTDVTLNLQRNNTFSDAVIFSADTQNVPAGISIAKNSSNNNQASFRVSYNSVVAAGNYSVIFSAEAGNVSRDIVVTLTVEASAPVGNSNYNITLVFSDTVSEAQKAIFNQAAEQWQKVITGDIPDIPNAQLPAGACDTQQPAFNGLIDDVVIFADIRPIDGPSRVLGRAGPCTVRTDGSILPSYGVMVFDSADAQGPLLTTTILHEMGHVLGIGTLWTSKALVNYTQPCPAVPRFTGAQTIQEWQNLGGSGNVPVEEDGGRGTACGHWDEETFDHELMTGFVEGNNANPLSRLTVASLQDTGYTVNLNAAESYILPGCRPNCTRALQPQGINLANHEILLQPIGFMDADGNTVLYKEE